MIKRILFLIISFMFLTTGLNAQFGDLDEKGNYYLSFIGGELDSTYGFNYWDGFSHLTFDGDSITYMDLFDEEGESGKIGYAIDDSNRLTLTMEDSAFGFGLISQDGQVTQLGEFGQSFGIYTAVKTSTGMTDADFSGDYFGAYFDVYGEYYDKQVAYESGSEIIDIQANGDGTAMVIFSNQDTIQITYEIEDDGMFIISEDYGADVEKTVAPIFAGALSSDHSIFSSSWIASDSNDYNYEENRFMIGMKKSSGKNNGSVQGDFLYYQILVENNYAFGFTQLSEISLDGAGHGTYRVMKQSSPIDSVITGILSYTVFDNGSIQVVPDVSEKQGEMVINGFISPDGKMFVLSYMDTEDYTESLFGIGIAKPVSPTAINDEDDQQIRTFHLEQNFPNPFNPETDIRFQLDKNSPVELVVFNSVGQKIKTLIDENKNAGNYREVWDGRDDLGNVAASGTYFYRLKTDFGEKTLKMTLIR